jgi:hypothetical protein
VYKRVGLGDDNSAGAAALANNPVMPIMSPAIPTSDPNADLSWCQWCQENRWLINGVLPGAAAFQPKCYNLNDQICAPMVVAYLAGAAPAAPPSQSVIDSQSPDATINDILARSQAAGVAAAVAAAANQGSYQSPICDKTSDQYNAVMCWLQDNKGTLEIAGLALLALWVLKGRL